MTDFANYGGSDEENAEIRRLKAEIDADPDTFKPYEDLVNYCTGLEGGLNRNSSPQALATLRDAFDGFLHKFPLLFGYWKKYAELEFNISGPESAEMVYERGIASIPRSVDLWADYCGFKTETTHDPELVRELFERAAEFIGLDFMAHPFWDKYIEYEERQEAVDKVFAILKRVIHIPLHQYARYFDRFRQIAHTRLISELISPEEEARYQAEVTAEAAKYGIQQAPAEVEQAIRAKIDAQFYEMSQHTQTEVAKRWTYEAGIKRPYFTVDPLSHEELANWRKYLDYEETEGDYQRIIVLYERCLVACALYDEFWFRYARFMLAQDGKEEEVRNIYLRAVTLFVPVSRPGIRLQFAYFEESQGRADRARAIHEAVLEKLPDSVEVIDSWANLERRQSGLDGAIQIYKRQIELPDTKLWTKAAVVADWAFLLWKIKGSVEEARTVFTNNVKYYHDSHQFWQKWLEFEIQQPTTVQTESVQADRIRNVFTQMRSKSRLPTLAKQELGQYYLNYLQTRGDKDAMKEFLKVDSEMFGPESVSYLAKHKPTNTETGLPLADLDAATRQMAEARYYTYYQLYAEPDPNAQGMASFH